jgi:hypothetical protein
MKKCVMGEGTTGDYIFQDNFLSTKWIKTKDTFVSHMAKTIADEIRVGTFQN